MLEDVPGGDASAATRELSGDITLSWAVEAIGFGSLLP